MLNKTAHAGTAGTADAAIQQYFHNSLGLTAKIRPWLGAAKLPYFLQETFDTREMLLLSHPVLLAKHRRAPKESLAEVRAQLEKLRIVANLPVIYVTDALASYERKRLVEQQVPFLVPGNQLYLPDLGIDLREYFRQARQTPAMALSPATQALLIAALLHKPWRADWEPAEIVANLGYTPMTLSRAVRELTVAGIVTIKRRGRERHLHTDRSPQEVWEQAKPILRSPVKRTGWVRPTPKWMPPRIRVAGMSALAQQSLLAEPSIPVYAVSATQWKVATQAGVKLLPEPAVGCCEWQMWNYSPELLPDSRTVDPLSLTLSLQDETDERVQLALEELRKQFPW
jgi:DNA-binding transcriptional ArsR family regulator